MADWNKDDEILGDLAAASRKAEATSRVADSDLVKSFGTGLAKGAIGVAGLPADAMRLGRSAMDAVAQIPGRIYNKTVGDGSWNLPEGMRRGAAAADSRLSINPADVLPGSDNIQNRVEGVTGKFYEPQTRAGKYASTVGEFIPGAMLPPGNRVVNALKYGVIPGVASEAAGQATEGTKLEPYARIGAALAGSQVADVAKRAMTPFPASTERQRLVNVLGNEGIDLTAGQKVGSENLRYLESAAKQTIGGGRAAAIAENQGEQFTKATLKRAGITADRATPDVIDDAFRRIGGEFDRLTRNNRAALDNQFVGDVSGIIGDYNSLVPEAARKPIIKNIADDILKRGVTTGQIDGEAYQAMRSRLDRAARSTGNDLEAREAFYGLRNALDDLMERNLSPADQQAWKEARRQYRNIIPIERAAAGAGENVAQGLISPSSLRNAVVQKQGVRNYVRGEGDFADLARAGEAVMKPLPDSGTAGRTHAFGMLNGPGAAVGGVVGAMAGGSGGGILGAGAGGMLGAALGKTAEVAIPAALSKALMSKPVQAYLGNQKFATPTKANERLIQALMAAQAARLPAQ